MTSMRRDQFVFLSSFSLKLTQRQYYKICKETLSLLFFSFYPLLHLFSINTAPYLLILVGNEFCVENVYQVIYYDFLNLILLGNFLFNLHSLGVLQLNVKKDEHNKAFLNIPTLGQ